MKALREPAETSYKFLVIAISRAEDRPNEVQIHAQSNFMTIAEQLDKVYDDDMRLYHKPSWRAVHWEFTDKPGGFALPGQYRKWFENKE